MGMRLFVGNLADGITDQELGAIFSGSGTVSKAEVVRGRGGRGRGFGYVELASEPEAARAMAEVNGREVQGRVLTVGEARSAARRKPMEEADQRSGFSHPHGYGGGGGGRGNRR